jgi:pimeloyl-ACP methyl ester carboxylesterase
MSKEKLILINNLEINYKIAGSGPAILILHGWGGSSDSWMKVQEILASQGYQVIVPDFPGFGKSKTPPIPWGIKDYTDFVLDLVNYFELENFFLLGHSFGGRIAIKFAIKHPEKLAGLILVSAAGIKPKKSFYQNFISFFAKIGNLFSFLPFYSFFRKIFYKFLVRKSDYLMTEGVLKETFLKIIKEDLTPYLSKISLPTLIIWGKKDKVTPLSNAYLMEKEIRNSRLEVLPGIGHKVNLEAPEKLSEIILRFLKAKI